MTRRKRVWLALQMLASAGLLALLFANFDFDAFAAQFRRAPMWFYGASFLVLAGGHLLYAFKWHLVLQAMGVRLAFRRVVENFLIGVFFNNFLPSTIGGDSARIYYLGREEGYAKVVTSVVVDRGLGFLAMATWSCALVWALDIRTPSLAAARTALTVAFAGFAAVFLLVLFGALRPLTDRLQRSGLLAPAARGLLLFRGAGWRLRARPDVTVAAFVIVLVYFIGVGWTYRTYFELSGNRGVPFVPLIAMLMAIGILANVPLSLNGIGVREQLHVLLLGAFGVTKELAVGMSILIFSQLLLLSVVGYVLWLRMKRSPALNAMTVMGAAASER